MPWYITSMKSGNHKWTPSNMVLVGKEERKNFTVEGPFKNLIEAKKAAKKKNRAKKGSK